MARQKEFLPDQALEKAMYLFWKQGYEGSSIEDIIQCTGIGRGSLYDTFRDKHSLYLAAFDRYRLTGREKLTMLRHQSGSLQEILQGFFQALIEEALADPEHRGCFMVNAALEMAPHDPEVAQRVQAGLDETREAFYHVLIKAQAAGKLPWTRDPHQLAHFLLNAYLGLRVLSRANPDRHVLEDIVTTTLSVLS
ncbi:MAG TPA: TetR/AcrR family transcriptional regulator [Ktedonobacteraceae bacterium]|nr:TetR/AcrR family transcriptional regulator [Ktedonobacteraceae bacterium]